MASESPCPTPPIFRTWKSSLLPFSNGEKFFALLFQKLCPHFSISKKEPLGNSIKTLNIGGTQPQKNSLPFFSDWGDFRHFCANRNRTSGGGKKRKERGKGGEAGADKSVHHLSRLNKSDSPIPMSRQNSIRTPRFVKENLFFRPLINLMPFTLYFFSQPSEPQNSKSYPFLEPALNFLSIGYKFV